jgi:hypothetical protein
MKTGECKMSLGFAPHRPKHLATRTPYVIGCEVEQHALSGTGLTRDNQHVAVVGAHTPDDLYGLGFSAHHRRTAIPRRALVPTSPSIVIHGCSKESRYLQH